MSAEYDALFMHMQQCVQCKDAFTSYHDEHYCEVGQELFEAWHVTA